MTNGRFLAAWSLAALACSHQATKSAESTRSALDVGAIDRSVAPGDDFYQYANGTWLKSAEIPSDRSSWGAGTMLVELTTKRTADLIAEAAKANAPPGSDARKVGDYYATFLDGATIEAKGLAPLRPTLDAVAAIRDARALARYLGSTLRADVDVFNATELHTDNLFGLWVAQDLDDPSRYSPFLLQGGLDMPDRDYYLDPSPRMEGIRGKYLAHVRAVLELLGVADAEAKAARVVELERRIAGTHATRVESEDVRRGKNHWARSDFAARAPGLDWDEYFGAAGLGQQGSFVVWEPSAITGTSALVRDQPLDAWKDYLAFHAVEHMAPYLPKAFADEHFAFHGTVLTGTPVQPERWKRAVAATDLALGEVVGKLYVARYFPASEKARAEEMVRNLVSAFRERIDKLPWMAPETKSKAKAKLESLKVGIGYPDKWRDYSGLEVIRGDAFGNAERSSLFEYRWNLEKLGRSVDRSEWVMNPQLVNAVNLPAMNALNFPAAILQPPFFDPSRPQVMDYGAAGSVIGHEISHSFDDQGAQFDAQGRLANWWTLDDFAHFEAQGARLARQYDSYQPFPDLHVNGKLTLSENIADLAGLAAAYDAYRISLGGKEAQPVQGFSGDQQFFLSFAQGWRQKIREPALRQRILTDGHAPAHYRALTVRNLDPWYAAFDVSPGQALFLPPAERVRMW